MLASAGSCSTGIVQVLPLAGLTNVPLENSWAQRAAVVLRPAVVGEEHAVGDAAVATLDLVARAADGRNPVAGGACLLVEHGPQTVLDLLHGSEVRLRLFERVRIGARQRVADRGDRLLGRGDLHGLVVGARCIVRRDTAGVRQCE
jgi:hypothetical protein